MTNPGVQPEELYVGPVNRVMEAMVGKNSLLLLDDQEPLQLGPVKADVSRLLPWARLSRLMKEVDTYLYAEIARRRAEGVEKREDGSAARKGRCSGWGRHSRETPGTHCSAPAGTAEGEHRLPAHWLAPHLSRRGRRVGPAAI